MFIDVSALRDRRTGIIRISEACHLKRRAIGISDALIRLSVGIEATEDLLEDFGQALKGI